MPTREGGYGRPHDRTSGVETRRVDLVGRRRHAHGFGLGLHDHVVDQGVERPATLDVADHGEEGYTDGEGAILVLQTADPAANRAPVRRSA